MTKLFLCLVSFLPFQLFAQGSLTFDKGSGKIRGALELMPNSSLTGGFQRIPTAHADGDPLLARRNWYGDGPSMRGLVGDAVLYLEWWTLLGDPVERYVFKWVTSGYYEIQYSDEGKSVQQTIYRKNLEKYPDLLKWFDNIAPNNVDLEIDFATGELGDKEYNDFRNKYNIMGDLGSEGYKMSYHATVNGANWLFAASGKDPALVVPQIPVGGWPDFLGMPSDVSSTMKSRLIELFRLGKNVGIKGVRITRIDWSLESLVGLAKRYAKYEKGELSPEEEVANGETPKNETNGDEFWNTPEVVATPMEVYRDPTNSKYGLKAKNGKRALPALYDQIDEGTNGVFFARKNRSLTAINQMGIELAALDEGWYHHAGNYVTKFSRNNSDDKCNSYYYSISDVMEFVRGSFVPSKPVYRITYQPGIVLRDNSARRLTEAEEAAATKRREEEDQKCVNQLHDYCKSQGAVHISTLPKK